MTNDEARVLFRNSGLTYNLVFDKINILKEYLKNKLDAFADAGGMKMELSSKSAYRFTPGTRNVECFFIGVDGPYFENREAISFNEDGFIGFAGWASSNNIQPILEAFAEFVTSESSPHGQKGK